MFLNVYQSILVGSKNSDPTELNSQKVQNSLSQPSCLSLKIDTNVGIVGDGPPTPTHSENPDVSDRIKSKLILVIRNYLIFRVYNI